MTKWTLSLAPVAVLVVATTAVATPRWIRTADQTEIRGRVTAVDHSGSQVVIEEETRLTIPPTAQVALVNIRPGEFVDARFTERREENTVLSLRAISHDEQAP